jgi:hypothetical protein
MTHNEVFKWFELYFELFAGNRVAVWFPNGKNSIRVRQQNDAEFIFTFNNHRDWKFETVDSFMKHKTKGGKVNG